MLCPGDTCRDPVVLRERVGLQSVTGNTRCAADSAAGSCGGASAPDVVHRLTLRERRRLVARAASVSGGFLAALYLRDQCASAPTERICDAGGGGGLAALDRFVDPGTYYLWLDGARPSAAGDYRVDVELDPQDTCVDPIPVDLPAQGSSVEISGSTSGASDTFQASCAGGSRSPDHVIALRVPTRARVVAETLSPTQGQQYDTALHLREACTSGAANPELACDDDGGSGTLSRLDEILDPGTYHLVVDGFSGRASGGYRLRIEHLAPPTSIRFPTPSDTFMTSSSTAAVFAVRGDRVDGTRSMGPASARTVDIDLRLARNTLRCGSIFIRSRVDNRVVSNLSVRPGDTRVQGSRTLPGAVTRPYAIRYEVVVPSRSTCGVIELDTTNSTITLR